MKAFVRSHKLALMATRALIVCVVLLGPSRVSAQDFPTGAKVTIVADNGMRMSRCNGCQTTVNNSLPDSITLTSAAISPYSSFEITNWPDGTITLRADTGRNLSYCNGCIQGGIVPDFIGVASGDAGPYGKFILTRFANGKYSIRAANGKYVARCNGCSPSLQRITGAADAVTAHETNPSAPHAQWTIMNLNTPKVIPATPNSAATPSGFDEDLAQRNRESQRAAAAAASRLLFSEGAKVIITSDTGASMSRCRGCQTTVNNSLPDTIALAASVGDQGIFTIRNQPDGTVKLLADSSLPLGLCNGCIQNGAVPDFVGVQTRDVEPFNKFTIEKLANGKYSIRASNGKYVTRCNGCSPSLQTIAKLSDSVTAHATDANAPPAQWTIVDPATRLAALQVNGNEEDIALRGDAAQNTKAPPGYFESGTKVSLIADNGQRMRRCLNCQENINLPNTVVLTSDGATLESTFAIISVGGFGPNGRNVLQSDKSEGLAYCNGCIVGGKVADFVGMNQGGGSATSALEIRSSRFIPGKYTIKAANGKYVARCHDCSPSFTLRTGGQEVVTAHVTQESDPAAMWTIEVVAPPDGNFPTLSNPNPLYSGDPQGRYKKTTSELMQDCMAQVQGRVARDTYQLDKNWDNDSLRRLCRGTANPWETIACFRRVLNAKGTFETGIAKCATPPEANPNFIRALHLRRDNPPTIPADDPPGIVGAPLNSADLDKVLTWIAGQVTAQKSPFCWRDTEKLGSGANACRAGYTSDGVTCWQSCPTQLPTNCGLGCASTSSECAWSVFDQITGPLTIAIFAASKGGSSDKTETAAVATNATKMQRAIASIKGALKATEAGVDAALVTRTVADFKSAADSIKKGYDVTKAAYNAATGTYKLVQDSVQTYVTAYSENFAVLTSPEISAAITARFGPQGVAFVKAQWALSDLNATLSADIMTDVKDVLSLVSIADPVGIVSTVNAYTHPVCSADTGGAFPQVRIRNLN